MFSEYLYLVSMISLVGVVCDISSMSSQSSMLFGEMDPIDRGDDSNNGLKYKCIG
jgi:hypothetical protein